MNGNDEQRDEQQTQRTLRPSITEGFRIWEEDTLAILQVYSNRFYFG